jgi:SNF family Na+-dependent transporter
MLAYFCIWKGVRSVGYAVRFTVIVPWLLLFILIVYNSTLEGARDGVQAYIGEWDLSILKVGTAWSDAAGQIFFSLSVTLGAVLRLVPCVLYAFVLE